MRNINSTENRKWRNKGTKITLTDSNAHKIQYIHFVHVLIVLQQSSSEDVKCIEEEVEDDQMASQETLQPVNYKKELHGL